MSADRLSRLDDYLSGAMPDVEADSFEEELFAGAPEAVFIDDLTRMAAHLVARTTFNIGHTRQEVEELIGKYRCELIDFGTGGRHRRAVPRAAELVISVLHVDLTGVEKVDVETYVEGHGLVKVMRDIRFDPADGALYGVCERELAEIAMAHTSQNRVIGVVGNERRVLAEFESQLDIVG